MLCSPTVKRLVSPFCSWEEALAAVQEEVGTEDDEANSINLNLAFEELQETIYRQNILERGKRVDGRAPADLRQISCDTSVLPVYTDLLARARPALVLATLGTSRDTQEMDGLSGGATSKSFILHYTSPYSVGETGRFGFTGQKLVTVPAERPLPSFQ